MTTRDDLAASLDELAKDADYAQESLLDHNVRCLEAKLLGGRIRAVAQALRQASERRAAYDQANPLGGPAKMFRAIAERIEAGEEFWSVLRDYGVTFDRALTSQPQWQQDAIAALQRFVALVPEPELVGMGYDSPPEHRTMEEHELGYALHLARQALAAAPSVTQGDTDPEIPDELADLLCSDEMTEILASEPPAPLTPAEREAVERTQRKIGGHIGAIYVDMLVDDLHLLLAAAERAGGGREGK